MAALMNPSSPKVRLYDRLLRDPSILADAITRHGHLFVAHSTLETVGATAIVIPTDAWFSVNPRW